MKDYEKLINSLILDSQSKNKAVSPILLGDKTFVNCNVFSIPVREQLFSNLNFLSNDFLLDIACNSGVNSFIFNRLYPFLKIEGFDIDDNAIQIANLIKEYNKLNINFLIADMYFYNYSKFNYILNCGIKNTFDAFLQDVELYKKSGFCGKVLLVYNLYDSESDIIFDEKFCKLRKEKTFNSFSCKIINHVEVFSKLTNKINSYELIEVTL